MKKFLTAGVLGLAMVAMSSSAANAGHFHRPPCGFRWVICHGYRRVPYTVCEVAYDHCGRPFKVYRTYFRTVVVPVRKLVKVGY